MRKHILLVEDDPSLGFVIKDNLEQKGYNVTLCTDGEVAYRTFKQSVFSLCILDVMLPRLDGFSLAKRVRELNNDVPILFLTAKSMMEDKIAGFQLGADDYITKPFSLEELILRIEVFLRRSNGAMVCENSTYQLGNFEFNYSNLILKSSGSIEKSLTQKEADVLHLLYQNRSRILKREEILKHVWGDDDYFMGRSLDVFISKLRKYLKDDPQVQIVNHHGVGFRLEINVVH